MAAAPRRTSSRGGSSATPSFHAHSDACVLFGTLTTSQGVCFDGGLATCDARSTMAERWAESRAGAPE
eukprot:293480-Chlamydomonas_euryale.AAC.2